MTVTVRNRGRRFEAYASVGGRSRRSSGFHTYEEAEAWARLREAELAGTDAPDTGIIETFGGLAVWAWETHYSRTKATKAAKSILGCLRGYFGDGLKLRALGRSQVRGYLDHLRESGASEATIYRKRAVLMKLLRDAHREGWIAKVPELPKAKDPLRQRVRVVTDDELAKVLRYLRSAKEPLAAQLVEFLVDTGCRVSEALGLRWADCRLADRAFDLWDTKDGRSRTVPMTKKVHEILTSLKARLHDISSLKAERSEASRTECGGPWEGMSYARFLTLWSAARGHLGLLQDKDFVPHALRHTFASRLVRRRVPLHEVRALLGHSTMAMTMRYAHLAPDNLAESVKVLDPKE